MLLLAAGLVSLSDGVCAFLESGPSPFDWKRVNVLCCGGKKINPCV